jgi:hypothetical protein
LLALGEFLWEMAKTVELSSNRDRAVLLTRENGERETERGPRAGAGRCLKTAHDRKAQTQAKRTRGRTKLQREPRSQARKNKNELKTQLLW